MNKTERQWRIRYSKASSRIRSQIRALEKKYPESVALERGGLSDWEGLRDLPKDYGLRELKMRTRLAEKVLQEGQYSLQRHRRAYAQASLTLEAKGIKGISNEKTGAFFRFLDDLKARGVAVYKPSRVWARLFREAKEMNMSKEDLEKNIDYWMKQFEKRKNWKVQWMPQTGSDSF